MVSASTFIPELHDLGKLIDSNIAGIPTSDGRKLNRHGSKAFGNVDWQRWGEPEPDTATWVAACHHHDPKWSTLPSSIEADWPLRVNVFLTIISDHLAATTGRALGRRQPRPGKGAPGVHRLWRPDAARESGALAYPIANAAQLRQVLAMVRTPQLAFAEYEDEFAGSLDVRAEDMESARRVSSLLSHMRLVGQYYRALHNVVQTDPEKPSISLGGVTANTVQEAEEKWVARLVQVQVLFHQQPVRPADLGVFDRLADCHLALEHSHPDHLMFRAADTLWLFLPGAEPEESEPGMRIDTPLEVYTRAGFFCQVEVRQGPLKTLGVWLSHEEGLHHRQRQLLAMVEPEWRREVEAVSADFSEKSSHIEEIAVRLERATPDERARLGAQRDRLFRERQRTHKKLGRLKKERPMLEAGLREAEVSVNELLARGSLRHTMLYPSDILESQAFDPPLCEICQMRQGRARSYATVTDYVCEVCQDLREGGFSQRQLTHWLEEGRGDVAWIKISILPQRVESTIASLFAAYVDEIAKDQSAWTRPLLKANLRLPALVRDFTVEYNDLLESVNSEVKRIAGRVPIKRLAADTWVMPIRIGTQVFRLLDCYRKAMRVHFPEQWAKKSDWMALPFQLGISVAPAKYPFYQQWRYVNEPPAQVSVRRIGHRPLEIDASAATLLLEHDLSSRDWQSRQARTYLHKLAAIERKSGSVALAAATFQGDLKDRKRKVPGFLSALAPAIETQHVRMADILAYFQLTTFGVR